MKILRYLSTSGETRHAAQQAHEKPPRWLRPGDTVTIEIEGIGALTNPVEEEKV